MARNLLIFARDAAQAHHWARHEGAVHHSRWLYVSNADIVRALPSGESYSAVVLSHQAGQKDLPEAAREALNSLLSSTARPVTWLGNSPTGKQLAEFRTAAP